MKLISRGLLVGGIVTAVLSAVALYGTASADPPDKDSICHVAGQSGNTIQITVSERAGTENRGNGGHLQSKHQDNDDEFVQKGQANGRGAEVFRNSADCGQPGITTPPENPPPPQKPPVQQPPVVDQQPPVVPPQAPVVQPQAPVVQPQQPVQQQAPVIQQPAPVQPQAPAIQQQPPARQQAPAIQQQAPARQQPPVQQQAAPARQQPQAVQQLPRAGSGGYLNQSSSGLEFGLLPLLGLVVGGSMLVVGGGLLRRSA